MNSKQTIRLSYERRGCIIANSTPEQEEILKGFKFNRALELFDIGFITPNQIVSYYCNKCNKTYENAPQARVSITMLNLEKKIDNVSVAYRCTSCNEFIYLGYLPSPRGIPEEFIEYDETGNYKKPTIESVNSLIDKLRSQAKEGRGHSLEEPGYGQDLETAIRWAEKINYDLSPQITSLAELFKAGYISRLERELPQLITEIKENAYGFNLVETDHITDYEGTGLDERMHQLRETIKLTTPKDAEINKDIVKILELYWEMGYKEKKRLLNKKKNLEERLAQEEEFLVNARRQQSDFIRRVNMPNEQVDEARNSPIDAWPLKD